MNWSFVPTAVELGQLQSIFALLTTWLQICGSYGHSTESQTPYLTHQVSPYSRFSLPLNSVVLTNTRLPLCPSF